MESRVQIVSQLRSDEFRCDGGGVGSCTTGVRAAVDLFAGGAVLLLNSCSTQHRPLGRQHWHRRRRANARVGPARHSLLGWGCNGFAVNVAVRISPKETPR